MHIKKQPQSLVRLELSLNQDTLLKLGTYQLGLWQLIVFEQCLSLFIGQYCPWTKWLDRCARAGMGNQASSAVRVTRDGAEQSAR